MTAESTFRIAFWALLGALLFVRGYFSLQVHRSGERLMPDPEAIQREGRGAFAVRVLLFFLLLAWLVLYAINPPWMGVLAIAFPDWLRWSGFALGLVMLVLLTWSQAVLGKQWSAQLLLREGHHLVTTGPYARVRHPVYTATAGWAVSLALLTANWVFVLLIVPTIVGLVSRVPREEQMMIEEFGEEYKAYMLRTGRFFPK
jgi:protein-S-isoprenylcysteine O-methyltransferase Ste14